MIGYVFEDGTIVWCKGLDDVELDDDDFTDYKDSLKRMRDHDDALDDELIEEEYQSRRINAE